MLTALPPPAPYGVYDSTTPSALPSDTTDAVYANGSFFARPSEVPSHSRLWITVNTSDPNANVLDVEPGDATPAQAGQWVVAHDKVSSQPAVVYQSLGNWSAVKAEVPRGYPVQYWIADPTGSPHLVPGSSATQWYWGKTVDISETAPGFGQGSDHGTDVHRASEHAHAAGPRRSAPRAVAPHRSTAPPVQATASHLSTTPASTFARQLAAVVFSVSAIKLG